jgi:uncharacterized protein YPO0396
MPKKIITERTLPIALHHIDKWSGKLTWEQYAERLATALGEKRISRHTLLSYPALVEAFNAKKDTLRASLHKTSGEKNDLTLDFAKQEIATLEAKVARLEKQNDLFREQFVRWQQNLYNIPNVDMEIMYAKVNKPMVAVNRR